MTKPSASSAPSFAVFAFKKKPGLLSPESIETEITDLTLDAPRSAPRSALRSTLYAPRSTLYALRSPHRPPVDKLVIAKIKHGAPVSPLFPDIVSVYGPLYALRLSPAVLYHLAIHPLPDLP
jgi:hypothetical protein